MVRDTHQIVSHIYAGNTGGAGASGLSLLPINLRDFNRVTHLVCLTVH
jgi:hypothetical protein